MPRTKDCLGFVVSFKILELVKKEFACFVDSKRNRSDKCNLKLLNSRSAATWPCIGEIFRDTAVHHITFNVFIQLPKIISKLELFPDLSPLLPFNPLNEFFARQKCLDH